MEGEGKTREQLQNKFAELRQRIDRWEVLEINRRRIEGTLRKTEKQIQPFLEQIANELKDRWRSEDVDKSPNRSRAIDEPSQCKEQLQQEERTQAESLNLDVRNLEETNRELEEFNYIVSHDLQEPVRTLTRYCQLLKEDLGDSLSPNATEDIKFITEAADRLEELISDFLEFSRAGCANFKEIAVDLNDCMTTVMNHLKARLKEMGGDIKWDALPIVNGDQTLVTRILQNLVDNGLKFRGEQIPCIQVSAQSSGQQWEITVADNGIGIEAEYLSQIFSPFNRLNRGSKYEGTGIGLTIARKFVEQHGGRIWAESEPGKGSLFKFTLNKFSQPSG